MTFHDRIPLYVSSAAAVLVVVAFAIGIEAGLGALGGAAVAIANALALRWLVSGLLAARGGRQAGVGGLLFAKMTAMLGVSAILIFVVRVDPVGFAIGFGALVLALSIGAAHARLATTLAPASPEGATTKGE